MDPSGLETSDKTITWGDDFAQTNLMELRSYSYRCTFCKRGFSNAQALGGHMNIHRKDRAKLREFSSENLLSLDIAKNTNSEDTPPANSSASEMKKQCNSDDDIDIQGNKHDNIVSLDKDNLVRRLPLFAEGPSVSRDDDHEKEADGGDFEKIVERSKLELMSHGEVDLELRLGPEPHVSNSINR
ncbi:hypothetical protein BUALT_Bualt09G0116100 [Buddleja alternifolia]|uniref:C2H2-type domain-containing protein n=1 Tax=Buddleja alternifolia TaxID=168488 RepID=A0AAV6X382_9LAMI|nr:hypothetical protein BUALT_Bualt09G0116100 [Buddleja alternifolia]